MLNVVMNQPRSYIRSELRGIKPYAVPVERPWVDLYLDANEAAMPLELELDAVRRAADNSHRYTTPFELEQRLAQQWGVNAEQIIVTAGADEAIDRLCRVCIEEKEHGVQPTVILPTPTFEMIGRFAVLAGARLISPAWNTPKFPLAEVLGAIDESTTIIAVVSPNNPTGAVITESEFRQIVERAGELGAVVLLDHAYAEFADVDLTRVALEYDNVVTMRTFSKAWGLAGLRVGYAIGAKGGGVEIITAMRAAGCPFPVSRLSLAAVGAVLGDPQTPARLAARIDEAKRARSCIADELERLGASPMPSQGNFVLARFANAEQVRNGLASLGIAVRIFKSHAPGVSSILDNCLRIGCPEDAAKTERVIAALRAVMKPEAILFDMDGVLADVSSSYRTAIIKTAESFGVRVTPEDVARIKAAGDANNDWIVTRRLLATAGVDKPLAEVTARFQEFYLGTPNTPGLETTETLIPAIEFLRRLRLRVRLGVVTGRPRDEAARFLQRFGLESLFDTVVCMEDAPAKPNPAPVKLTMQRMNIEAAWLIGDTPDDLIAARKAGVMPLAIVAPSDRAAVGDREEHQTLERHGPALILDSLAQLEDIIP